MKKIVFFILFGFIISGFVFSQSNEELAFEMFNRIHNNMQVWWQNNYSVVDDFSFSPRTNSNIQIISTVLSQQMRNNTVMFQNLANRKELTEEKIYSFYIEQYKLLNYLETTIGGNREANNMLVALAEEMRTMVMRACLFLIEQ